MNRAEVKAATDYLTTKGLHVRVLDTEPGWAIVDGDWVEAKGMSRRYSKAKGWVEYQSNFAIRAEVIDADGWPTSKVVLHPRVLTRMWTPADEAEAGRKTKAANANDVLTRRLRARGLAGVSMSTDGKHVTVITNSLTKALGMEED